MIGEDGWHTRARRLPSPHHDPRPAYMPIELLVIHCISLPEGHFGGPYVEELFLGRLDHRAHPSFDILEGLRVSAHFVIDRQGRLTQYVSCSDRAWHAGASSFEGRDRCNDFSIGIELEGTDKQAFTARQYVRLARLTLALAARYPSLRAIRGHSDIAPGRKTDPGPHFDWQRYRSALGATVFCEGMSK